MVKTNVSVHWFLSAQKQEQLPVQNLDVFGANFTPKGIAIEEQIHANYRAVPSCHNSKRWRSEYSLAILCTCFAW